MQPVVLVASAETPDGERFFVVRPGAIPIMSLPMTTLMSEWGGLAPAERLTAWQRAWQQLTETAPLRTEQDIRIDLGESGLSAAAIDMHVQRARRARANLAQWITSGAQFLWESTTAIGYRNGEAQVVVERTDLPGTLLYQRVYRLRCDDCGHEYGANGCEVHGRRCPGCQNGAPGLPTSNILV